MIPRVIPWLLVIWLGPYGCPGLARAQMADLTGEDATSEKILGAIMPQGESSAVVGTLRPRGVGSRGARPLSCASYRTRGIAGTPAHPRGVRVSVRFEFNSAELSPEGMRTLDEIGKAVSDPRARSACFQMEGHTDSVGSSSYNQVLSEKRARRAARYLRERYNVGERVSPVGKGEASPIADNASEVGRQKNRRVEIIYVGPAG